MDSMFLMIVVSLVNFVMTSCPFLYKIPFDMAKLCVCMCTSVCTILVQPMYNFVLITTGTYATQLAAKLTCIRCACMYVSNVLLPV